MKPGTLMAMLFLAAIAMIHLARAVFGIEVLVAGHLVPVWLSLPASLISGGLALALWRENRTSSQRD